MAVQQMQRVAAGTLLRRRRLNRLVLALMAAPLLAFVFLPLASLILRTGLDALSVNLWNAAVLQAAALSMATSATATLLTIGFGTPLAYLLARYQFPGRTLVETLLELPMVLPPAVAGVALLMAFGRRGVLGVHLSDLGVEIAFTQAAVVLAQCFVAAPFYVRAAVAGLAQIDRDAEQAAAVDGAGPWIVFTRITLPLVWPALFGGAVMTWARALGEFGATIIFAGNFPGRTQTMPLAIYIGFELDLYVALTLSIILLACSFSVLLIVKGLLRQRVGEI